MLARVYGTIDKQHVVSERVISSRRAQHFPTQLQRPARRQRAAAARRASGGECTWATKASAPAARHARAAMISAVVSRASTVRDGATSGSRAGRCAMRTSVLAASRPAARRHCRACPHIRLTLVAKWDVRRHDTRHDVGRYYRVSHTIVLTAATAAASASGVGEWAWNRRLLCMAREKMRNLGSALRRSHLCTCFPPHHLHRCGKAPSGGGRGRLPGYRVATGYPVPGSYPGTRVPG